MADLKAKIIISAQDKASSVLKSLGGSITTALKTAPLAAAAALAAMTFEMVKATQAAIKQEDSNVRLALALRSVGRGTEETNKALRDHAAQLQAVTRFGDETIQEVQALLIQLGRLSDTEDIKRATEATLNFAEAAGIDIKTAGLLFAKAAQGQTASLSRYGLILDENIPQQDKFNALLELAENGFEGVSNALAGTFQGRLQQATNSFGDLQEEIGATITESTAVLESLEILRDIFPVLGEFVNDNRDVIQDWIAKGLLFIVEASAEVTETLADFAVIFEELTDQISGNVTVLNALKGVFVAVTAQMLPLITTTRDVADILRTNRDITRESGEENESLSKTLETVTERIRGGAEALRELIKEGKTSKEATDGLITGLTDLGTAVENVSNAFADKLNKQLEEGQEQIFTMFEGLGELEGPALQAGTDIALKFLDGFLAKFGPEALTPALEFFLQSSFGALDVEVIMEKLPNIAEALGERITEQQEEAEVDPFAAFGFSDEQFDEAAARLDDFTEQVGEKIFNLQEFGMTVQDTFERGLASFLETAILNAENTKQVAEGVMRSLVATVVGALAQMAVRFIVNKLIFSQAKKQESSAGQAANLGRVFSGQFAAQSEAPWPLNLAAPAVATTMTGIAASGIPAAGATGAALGASIVMQEGGLVPFLAGARAGEDSVMALLTPGELVIPQPVVEQFQEIMGMRSAAGRFQGGGVVGGEDFDVEGGGRAVVNAFILPTDPDILQPMLEAISDAVERFGARLVASEVAT